MPSKSSKNLKNTERTREIEIFANAESLEPAQNSKKETFSLSAPLSEEKAEEKAPQKTSEALPSNDLKKDSSLETQKLEKSYQLNVQVPVEPHDQEYTPKKENQQKASFKKNTNRIWYFLEWIATSAVFFAVIFFVINYSSYADLLKFKINQLQGISNSNPILEKLLPSAEPVTQQLLPVMTTAQQSKTQLPPLDLEVAPPDDRIIIPKIGKNIPIVKVSSENLLKRDWNALEKDIQSALQDGVVHYPGTAEPGMAGNVVITGHSSYFPWDPGRFKDVFSLLHNVSIGDVVVVYHNQKPYSYKVYDKKEVQPSQVDVLVSDGETRLTLITCTPVGTNLRRLIVLAKPI